MPHHWEKHGLTYLQHLRRAEANSLRLLWAGFTLVIHGLLPGLFEYTASDVVRRLAVKMARRNKDRVLIRFNRKWREDRYQRKWRIITGGHEVLASNVILNVPSVTCVEPVTVDGDAKFHIRAEGVLSWKPLYEVSID